MESQDVIKLYKNGMSKYAIAKQFEATAGKIHSILRKYKIPLRRTNKNQKYTCNDNYFSKINSHEKAYWLGFLAADGSVSSRDNEISLGLSQKDLDHVNKFRDAIQANNKIYTYDAIVKDKIYPSCKFSFHSPQMKRDLSFHNIKPNKSKTLKLSKNVPSKFINSYLLGIFDGDGSFFLDQEGQHHFSLIGSKSSIKSFQNYLIKNCKISKTKLQQEKRSKMMWYLNYGGNNNIRKIANFLYKNSPIFLERKRNIISHLQASPPTHKHAQV